MELFQFLFTIGIGLLAAIVLPAVGMLFVECLAAAFSRRTSVFVATRPSVSPKANAQPSEDSPAVAVLIPAHNEQQIIGTTLSAIVRQVDATTRVVVIADNCSDDTASAARQAGAEVIERDDRSRLGKGFALAYGMEHLKLQPPDVVVVIDADTEVDPGTIQAISRQAAATGRPVQAINILSPPETSGCRDQVSAFAFRVRNLVRPLGQAALGQPCQLMGTGMALPWQPLTRMDLASSNIVEDLQLGIDFALAGRPPQYCPAGRVRGVLPSTRAAASAQRQRWEHGHIATILHQAPRLLVSSIRHFRFDLFWFAMDLAVPPLALVVILWCALMVASLMGFGLGLPLWPVWMALVAGLLLLTAVLTAWGRFARDIPLRALVSVPFYIIEKLPIYFGFIRNRQVRWVRTERA